jgi:hypothetical protein
MITSSYYLSLQYSNFEWIHNNIVLLIDYYSINVLMEMRNCTYNSSDSTFVRVLYSSLMKTSITTKNIRFDPHDYYLV